MNTSYRIDHGIALVAILILTAACSMFPFSPGQPLQVDPVAETAFVGEAPALPDTLAGFPTALPEQPLPVMDTPTAAVPPTEIPTPVPSPTPTPHPLNIVAQRQTPFPGSEIIIEEVLEPGVNYSRYIASYISEGLKIYALLTIPYGEMPITGWPAIVFNHGYIPPAQYRTTERYIAYVDWLARSGYIVFRIDYRGHDRSEGQPTGAYSHPGYTADVLNAVAAIQSFSHTDPERIGMWGHSMGGYLTLRAMVISPQIKAGVIWAGVVASHPDLLSRWRRTDRPTSTSDTSARSGWRTDWVEQYGAPEDNPDFWNGISANSYLADISGPVQLHHGTADESVPLEFSVTLAEQMQAAGQPVELHTYEGDNHNISNSFNQAMTRTIEFFDRYLK